MYNRYILSVIISICFSPLSFSQQAEQSMTLSEKQVIDIVKKFHPVAKQAIINVEKAKADILIAKGAFDPYAAVKTGNKTFDGTEYYNYFNPELTIPAWYGIELSAGIEKLTGNRTDPQETTGKTSFAGISIPLAKNLMIDKRRAALQQSKIYKELSEAERNSILNDLVRNAVHAYWHWVQQYRLVEIARNTVLINEKRFSLIKLAFRQGDRPAIDTTEALTQLQSFRYLLTEAELNFQNAGLGLSVFLWKENNEPYNLPASVLPIKRWEDSDISQLPLPMIDEVLLNVKDKHPDLVQYNFKLDALTVDKKLKFQELLPTINFRYNQLGKGYDLIKTTTGTLFDNNYQYGLQVGIPLRLSNGRGEYKKAKLKLQETELIKDQKELEIENKIRSYYNELANLKSRVVILQQQYQNYLVLQKGEETRFYNGESSLFLVNSRESKTLEALQKLAEIETKYYKTIINLQWAAGLLYR